MTEAREKGRVFMSAPWVFTSHLELAGLAGHRGALVVVDQHLPVVELSRLEFVGSGALGAFRASPWTSYGERVPWGHRQCMYVSLPSFLS